MQLCVCVVYSLIHEGHTVGCQFRLIQEMLCINIFPGSEQVKKISFEINFIVCFFFPDLLMFRK